MPDSLMLLGALIALIFDFLNGRHDAANSIATVVSTRVLSPNIAVVWAAFFNFIAFLFFGLHVAPVDAAVSWALAFVVITADPPTVAIDASIKSRRSRAPLGFSDMMDSLWRASHKGASIGSKVRATSNYRQ
jgi:Phosphate transporter family